MRSEGLLYFGLCVGDLQRIQATVDVCKTIPVAYLQMHYNEVKPCQVDILNRCKEYHS
jgi:hypothetical protein